MKFDTKVVRAGIEPDPTTGSILPPIYETATFVLPEVGKDLGFDYTRSSNPTRQVLEANLAAIESGKYVRFPPDIYPKPTEGSRAIHRRSNED